MLCCVEKTREITMGQFHVSRFLLKFSVQQPQSRTSREVSGESGDIIVIVAIEGRVLSERGG